MRTLPTGDNIGQAALIVRDLDRAMITWVGLGIGPWRVYTFSSAQLESMTLRGREQPQVVRLALCSAGSMTYEVIEPRQGPSIYEEHLVRRGEGLHHLGYYVDDFDAAVAAMEERGYAVLQAGRGFGVDGDGAYAYFDTERDFGCVLEAIVGPRRMPEPERVFPGPA